MSQKRFQNRRSNSLLNLKGRFTLSYIGGATFYYTIPSKNHPIVGKFGWGSPSSRPYRFAGLALVISVVTYMSVFSDSGEAVPISTANELKSLEMEGRFDELEEKSEEAKAILYNIQKPIFKLNKNTVKIKKYRVKSGDTLSEIANKHGIPATIIAKTSNIKFHSMLKKGQELLIPEKPGLMYKVKKGDTLASILQQYKVKVSAVIQENPSIADLDMVAPGMNLFLPNAKIPRPTPNWLRPVYGRFSSRFGWRRHPILRKRHFHAGVDLAVRYKPVRAARSGRVIYAGYLGSYGKVVVIRHDNRYKTLYAHLSKIRVRNGAYVKQGRNIAVSGNTGRSTGPHLHFEVIRNNKPVNPRRFIRF